MNNLHEKKLQIAVDVIILISILLFSFFMCLIIHRGMIFMVTVWDSEFDVVKLYNIMSYCIIIFMLLPWIFNKLVGNR
jgi:hypothetical protein